MPQKCTALYYTKVILMLQWYNHSIDITTLSSYTSVIASVLTYCHKKLLQYITNSNLKLRLKITYTYLHHYYCTITALT